MSTLSVRRTLVAVAAGGVLAASGLLWAGDANATPETDYLTDLTDAGLIVYDTTAALSTGYAVCQAFNTTTGDIVAENLYRNTTWADVPNKQTAAAIVVAAGMNLCPWHFHPERSSQLRPVFVA